MGDIADGIIENGINGLASGENCHDCGATIYSPPGCQCVEPGIAAGGKQPKPANKRGKKR